MARIIGDANEFYRLRLVRLDESDTPEFEWRDDILWRRGPSGTVHEAVVFRVEAVDAADEDAATQIAQFDSADEARDFMDDVQLDLDEMTKSEFEVAYLAEPQRGFAADVPDDYDDLEDDV